MNTEEGNSQKEKLNTPTHEVEMCGNWTQVLEQLHSQQLPITHANYSQKETEYGAEH